LINFVDRSQRANHYARPPTKYREYRPVFMLIKHTVQQYLTQLTTVKVCIQVASKLTKVAKVARKLCTTAKTV